MIINIFVLLFFFISVYLSFKYKFIHLNFFKSSIKTLKNSLKNKDNQYKAFLLSLGNHIGAGNIVGVASALIIGGLSSVFWMNICLLFTSIYSLMENSLAVKYQMKIEEEYRGGSPFYIKYGLKNNGLSYFFSFLLIVSSTFFFLPIQVNSLKSSIVCINDIPNIYMFLFILLFSMLFLFKGTKKILKISETIVPFVSLLFLVLCLSVIIVNYKALPNVIYKIIFSSLNDFKLKTVIGAFIGGSINLGFRRSIFSNEAGIGTAPTFNAMIKAKPIEQAYLQVFACFIDTIVMCSLFALVILLSNIDYTNMSSFELSIYVFTRYFGNDLGLIIGSFFLFFFSLATIIGSFYSGETNCLFFCNNNIKFAKNIYRMMFTICLFLGVYMNENNIWNLVDYGIVILGIINVYVLLKIEKEFKFIIDNK